jgi:hypothetical protein
MRRYDVVREICDYMLDLGWGPYQNDHEDANGQFEMNWEFDDALATADKHSFFKFMVKSVAEKHGLRATFMPKPVEGLTGNGCHAHVSVWDAPGDAAKTNVFAIDPTPAVPRPSWACRNRAALPRRDHETRLCAGGDHQPHGQQLQALNAPVTLSGATWAPNTVTWTGNNRTHMVRVPGPGRFELRLPDGAANPYLLQAVIIAAGLDGMATEADPGKRHDIDMYAEGHKVRGAVKLPLNMLDALRAFDKDTALKAAMGKEFSAAFLKLKPDPERLHRVLHVARQVGIPRDGVQDKACSASHSAWCPGSSGRSIIRSPEGRWTRSPPTLVCPSISDDPALSASVIETAPFGLMMSFTKNAVSDIIGPHPASYQPTEPSSNTT